MNLNTIKSTCNFSYQDFFSIENINKFLNKSWKLNEKILLKTLCKTQSVFTGVIKDYLLILVLAPIFLQLPSVKAVFSPSIIYLADTCLNAPTTTLTHLVENILPTATINFNQNSGSSENFFYFLAVGLSEEFLYRGVIQKGILQKFPTFILRKTAPSYQKYVDQFVARTARITFTSFVFALAHAKHFGDAEGLLMPQFIFGLRYSHRIEKNMPLLELASMHALYNLAIFALLSSHKI